MKLHFENKTPVFRDRHVRFVELPCGKKMYFSRGIFGMPKALVSWHENDALIVKLRDFIRIPNV